MATGARIRHAGRESAQVEDRIADDLAGAVESNVAAAVAFEKPDAALSEEFG